MVSKIEPLTRPGFLTRAAILTIISAVINLFINSPAFSSWSVSRLALTFPTLPHGEIGYLVFIVQAFFSGLLLLLLVAAVIRLEKPSEVLRFFKVGPVDPLGILMIVVLVALLDGLEMGFLRRLVYEPARSFLSSLGLPGQATLSVSFAPDPHLVGINVLLLVLVFWVEVPEELFFRGYIQNHLQDEVGLNLAIFVGALVWAFWHLFTLADVLRILVLGLAFGLVFRLRQNTTPLAIWHPLGNRLLVLFSLIGPLIIRPR